MGIKRLAQDWEGKARQQSLTTSCQIRLRRHDMARVQALADMYPGRTSDTILAELIQAALDDIEGGMPYVKGERVVAEDEFGDPIYEDVGPTRKFYNLTRKHLQPTGS